MGVQISIILPIYNVSKYLGRCMESIVGKHEEKIEILLIDDGSTDESGIIADQFQINYKNVKCYHKTNGGLSDARNFGLLRANGKYVFFLDSDDFVKESTIDILMSKIEEEDLDVLLWDADLYDENNFKCNISSAYYHHKGIQRGQTYTGKEIIEAQLNYRNDYVTTVWLGLYRREFLLNNNLYFEKDLLHEDEMWTQKVLVLASKVKYVQESLYCYRIRSNSIMRKNDKNYTRNIECLIYIYSSLFSYFDWKIVDVKFRNRLKGNIVKRYLHTITQYNVANYPMLCKRINKWQLFVYSTTIKDKIRALILLFSVHFYCWISKVF